VDYVDALTGWNLVAEVSPTPSPLSRQERSLAWSMLMTIEARSKRPLQAGLDRATAAAPEHRGENGDHGKYRSHPIKRQNYVIYAHGRCNPVSSM
jgi:hypothetical protein